MLDFTWLGHSGTGGKSLKEAPHCPRLPPSPFSARLSRPLGRSQKVPRVSQSSSAALPLPHRPADGRWLPLEGCLFWVLSFLFHFSEKRAGLTLVGSLALAFWKRRRDNCDCAGSKRDGPCLAMPAAPSRRHNSCLSFVCTIKLHCV